MGTKTTVKEKAVLRARPFLMGGNEFCSILALQQQRQDSDHNLKYKDHDLEINLSIHFLLF